MAQAENETRMMCYDVDVMWDSPEAPGTFQVWALSEEEASDKVGDVMSNILDLKNEGQPGLPDVPDEGECISVVGVSKPYIPEVPPWARK